MTIDAKTVEEYISKLQEERKIAVMNYPEASRGGIKII